MASSETGRKKLIFVIAEDWYFWSHRLPLARAAQQEGFDVIIATRVQKHGQSIRDEGFKLVPLQLTRESYSPFKELRTLLQLRNLYRTERPDIVHHVALKPILYGSIAALGNKGVKVVNALAGLGYLVASSSLKARLLRLPIWTAFRFLLNRPDSWVILQNVEDRELVTSRLRVATKKAALIRGAGVNCDMFQPGPEPEGTPIVMLCSRMLWNKGILEFIEAARLLRQKGANARFVLVGDVDPGSPSGIPRHKLAAWNDAGVIEWWGHRQNMAPLYHAATLVCLPSHGGEGVPKVLLEAAACGRAIVASDVPGCHDIVRQNVNGLLVPARNVAELAKALLHLLQDHDLRNRLGRSGPEIARREFSQEIVVAKTLDLYGQLTAPEMKHAVEDRSAG
jgi:glycosyltransferase involved in cell wall biosynthesis